MERGRENTLFIHLTLVPYIASAGETKTKPTQHSVKELRSIGIQPDILLCRSEKKIPDSQREKIALFTNVETRAVISVADAESIYEVPLKLHEQALDIIVAEKLGLKTRKPDLTEWQKVVEAQKQAEDEINVAMVGKYMELQDAYKSLTEALTHAGIHTKTQVNVHYISSEIVEEKGTNILENYDAILIPGGFGDRGIEGKIASAKYARENNIPFLGICLGMQIALIEFARNKAHMPEAHSTEFNADTIFPVIALVTEWQNLDGTIEKRTKKSDLGGTMRLGAQTCQLKPGTLAFNAYNQKPIIKERHRHRYEVNNELIGEIEKAGLVISGRSADDALVEIIELSDHPWFLGCQFHPEFTSNPRDGHPLFISYILATKNNSK